jgi:hypothetical protein
VSLSLAFIASHVSLASGELACPRGRDYPSGMAFRLVLLSAPVGLRGAIAAVIPRLVSSPHAAPSASRIACGGTDSVSNSPASGAERDSASRARGLENAVSLHRRSELATFSRFRFPTSPRASRDVFLHLVLDCAKDADSSGMHSSEAVCGAHAS